MQEKVQDLVRNGQLEFVGGGWVQQDEALNNVDAMTLQIELGHTWLRETFGIASPKVAWQLDPFGYSSVTPSLFSRFGYEYTVINRVEEDFLQQIGSDGAQQFVWTGSDMGNNNGMFTYILTEHYDTPEIIRRKNSKSYCWNGRGSEEEKIEGCAQALLSLLKDWAKKYNSESFMLLFGDDFEFENLALAKQDFENLERVMMYMRDKLDIDIRFATASQYFDHVKQSSPKLPSYTGDFFPYASRKNNPTKVFWTGFYATRPAFKASIAKAQKLNQAANIMSGLALGRTYNSPEVAVSLHHDAITGTCRPHVIQSYESGFEKAEKEAYSIFSESLETQKQTGELQGSHVSFYNPLNRERDELLSFISPFAQVGVRFNGQPVEAQAVVVGEEVTIYFRATLPALSVTTFQIEDGCVDKGCAFVSTPSEYPSSVVSDDLEIELDDDGLIQVVRFGSDSIEVQQKYVHYGITNRSGAYIFMPPSEHTVISLTQVSFTVQEGPLLSFVHSVLRRVDDNSTIKQYILVPSRGKIIQLSTTVSAVKNEEFMYSMFPGISGFSTYNTVDLRQYAWSGNKEASQLGKDFHPMSGGVLIGSESLGVFVTSDYPTGVGKMETDIQFMLHRNINNDDDWGLAFKLDDFKATTQKFRLNFGSFEYGCVLDQYLKHHTPVVPLVVSMVNPVEVKAWSWAASGKSWPFESSIIFGESDENAYLSSIGAKDGQLVYRLKNLHDFPTFVSWLPEDSRRLQLGGYDSFEEPPVWQVGKEFCKESCENGMVLRLPDTYIAPSSVGFMLRPSEYVAVGVPLSNLVKLPQSRSILAYFEFEVYGKVQGVYFRKHTQEKAEKINLTGWVANTDYGTVVGFAEGDKESMDNFKTWLRKVGSPKSEIEKLVISDEGITTEHRFFEFEIREDVVHVIQSQEQDTSEVVEEKDFEEAIDEKDVADVIEEKDVSEVIEEKVFAQVIEEKDVAEVIEEKDSVEVIQKIFSGSDPEGDIKVTDQELTSEEMQLIEESDSNDELQATDVQVIDQNIQNQDIDTHTEQPSEVEPDQIEEQELTQAPLPAQLENMQTQLSEENEKINEEHRTDKEVIEKIVKDPIPQIEPDFEPEEEVSSDDQASQPPKQIEIASDLQPEIEMDETIDIDISEQYQPHPLQEEKKEEAKEPTFLAQELDSYVSTSGYVVATQYASSDDIQLLFYLLVLCLSVIALITIGLYFRIKKRRTD